MSAASRAASRVVAETPRPKRPQRLPRGFRNVGNSCFLNAVVQSLASVRGMHAYLAHVRQDVPASATDQLLACQLQTTLVQTAPPHEKRRDCATPPAVASHPAVERRFLRQRRQQDAHELMQFLLCGVEAEAAANDGLGSSLASLVGESSPLDEESDTPAGVGLDGDARDLSWGSLSVDSTDELLPEVLSGAEGDESGDYSKPLDPFLGTMSESLQFTECGHRNEATSTPFRDISLAVPVGEERRRYGVLDTIEDYLRYFTVQEVVEDVRCERCDDEVAGVMSLDPHLRFSASADIRSSRSAQKQLSVTRAPEALCLHIRRLVSNGVQMVKHTHHVDFGLQLDLLPFCGDSTQQAIRATSVRRRGTFEPGSESMSFSSSPFTPKGPHSGFLSLLSSAPHSPSKEILSSSLLAFPDLDTDNEVDAQNEDDSAELLYDLVSVVVHHGSAQGGHYAAYRRVALSDRVGRDHWVHVSDENVRSVPVSEVLKAQAYMLFYERGGNSPQAGRRRRLSRVLDVLS